jgi:acetaldehyde dehydrogenase / alcohol dehydrogenase
MMGEQNDPQAIARRTGELVMRAKTAAAVFSQYDREHVDSIVRAAYLAGLGQRCELARAAVEETGLGNYADKVVKNTVATLLVYEAIRAEKTVGVLREDRRNGVIEVAEPLGVVLGVTPITNPTSTVMFKALLALKTRNALIISPPSKAHRCSVQAARTMYEAALGAGAPEDCIVWLDQPDHDVSRAVLNHPGVSLILATGGASLVHAAYSSGTPAIGVGPGNVPVYVDPSADLDLLADSLVLSKTFDNGMICASEQSVVAHQDCFDAVVARLQQRGGYLCTPEETKRLGALAIDAEKGAMSMAVIGQSAEKIARQAGVAAPPGTKLLLVQPGGVGPDYPLSREKLSPILSLYSAESFTDGVNLCDDLLHFGGIGHTAGIFANDEAKVAEFGDVVNAGRILVNQPTSHGAVGGTFNTIVPSLTLGCGTGGGNITTDNITATHLINVKRILMRRLNYRFLNLPDNVLMDPARVPEQIEAAYIRNY